MMKLTSGNIFAREFLAQILPLDTSVHTGGGDGPLLTTAPLFGDIITIDSVLGYYRVHGGNDSAISSFDPAQFRHRAALDEKRVAFLEEIAAKKRVELRENLLDRNVLYQSYLLCEEKLAGRGVMEILKRARQALIGWWHVSCPLGQKITLGLWILGVTLSPGPLSKKMIALRFLPTTRPSWIRRLIRRFGIGLRTNNNTASELSLPRRNPAA